ncbi:sensor histidine kinase [Streptomyces avicenniae]|uniref:sensor histidine kinase n=1 Tax=Streptomyces avicenniae TaxID=500153 RepID=UPI000DA6377D|nr:ATP-binding protein [Streptomyces avicenniae]
MPEQLRTGAPTGRHSRPAGTAPGAGAPGCRRRLLRLAVLPAALVTVVATVTVAYLLAEGGPRQGAAGGFARWAVPAAAAVLVGTVLAGAVLLALTEARLHAGRLTALRRQASRGRVELHALLRKVERGERIKPPEGAPPAEPDDADAYGQLGHEIAAAGYAAESAVAQAASLAGAVCAGDERVEVFVNLARRMQSFVHRQLEYLDELENDVEDPELLKGLFHIDHLATRIRRHAENLAVLGGAVSRRQWTRPVCMSEVLRSCIAEVEHYSRVKLVPPFEGTVRGHAVADVVHLLAELVENATEFSAPQTQVLLRVQRVTAGLAIEVEDRGLGMTVTEQNRMNAILSGAERLDVAQLLEDGRVGLFVVSTLAKRHDIVVQLQSNIYGGVQAVLVLPHELLGDESEGHYVPGRPVAQAAEPYVLPAPAAAPAPPAVGSAPEQDAALPPRPTQPPAAPTTSTAPTPATPATDRSGRPPLPRRRRPQHLVPPPRDTGQPPQPPQRGGPGPVPAPLDPGLTAAFRRGARLADEEGER